MAEYTCDVCKTNSIPNMKFNEEEKSLTNDVTKCILHCEKGKDTESDDVIELFTSRYKEYHATKNEKNGIKTINKIHFPKMNTDLFQDIFNKGDKLSFKECHFYGEFNLESITYAFSDCRFYNDVIVKNITLSINNTEKVLFKRCVFNKKVSFDTEKSIDYNVFKGGSINKVKAKAIVFTQKMFIYNKKTKLCIDELELVNCVFDKSFIIKNTKRKKKIEKITLENSIFSNKLEILKCEIDNINFKETRFKDFCNFEESKFIEIKFENTVFEKLVTFQKTQFLANVDFNYVTFKDHSIFKNSVFKNEINLENTLFEKNPSFYAITSDKDNVIDIEVANRETARIIKDSFEKDNNIIESNRFYKLEMKKREEELNQKENESWFERFIFNIHGIISNHSQDALLALFWIINIGFIASLFDCFTKVDYVSDFLTFHIPYFIGSIGVIFAILGVGNIIKEYNKIHKFFTMFGLYCIYVYNSQDYGLSDFANVINPFSIMTKGDTLNLGMLIFKVIIAYLIYQFVVSVRQNTRRK